MHPLKTAHFGSFFYVWPPSSPGREKYKTPSRAHGCLRRAGKRGAGSFGSLLYELVTGRRAFQGDSNISTLAAIIEREPKPMARVERPARKIATGGRRPQFSPDGEWIAYGVGWASNGVLLSGRNQCRIYIVPAAGGTPRQLRADFVGLCVSGLDAAWEAPAVSGQSRRETSGQRKH